MIEGSQHQLPTLPQNTESFKTPQKQIAVLQPGHPYKKKLRSHTNKTKLKESRTTDLVLFDSLKKNFCRFRLFLDDDVGFDKSLQNVLQPVYIDEDCSSTEQNINEEVQKGISQINQAITKKKKN